MKEICAKEYCTGCTACMNVCQHKAIMMAPDCYGFLYPSIDATKCVDCKLCTKVCPANNNVKKRIPKEGYVCHAKSVDEQMTSTSGGAISVISRFILKKGGIVYGCTITIDNETKHIRVSSEEQLAKLKGSKYVQSNLESVFLSVKGDLTKGTLVLFSGTPCQVAGLNSFLRKDYSNLYTIDFVCHGVPSQAYLKDSLASISSKKDILSARLLFRYKHIPFYYRCLPDYARSNVNIRSTYGLHFVDNKCRLVYSEVYPYNNYILGFLTGLTYRESCYKCKYATPGRVSDFTCGDYYDKALTLFLPGASRLASMLSINSTRAELLFSQISSYLEYHNVEYRDIVDNHRQLREPMPMHSLRSEFLAVYPKLGFEVAMDQVMRSEKKRIIRNQKLDKIANLVYKIPVLRKLRGK